MPFCPSCGVRAAGIARFCGSCGFRLQSELAAAVPDTAESDAGAFGDPRGPRPSLLRIAEPDCVAADVPDTTSSAPEAAPDAAPVRAAPHPDDSCDTAEPGTVGAGAEVDAPAEGVGARSDGSRAGASSRHAGPLRWLAPFRGEQDACDEFAGFVGWLTEAAAADPAMASELAALEHARVQHRKHEAGNLEGNSTLFIAPAVHAAIAIARAWLDVDGRHGDAFRASNRAGEYCKILLSRAYGKHAPLFEDLLTIACYAAATELQRDGAIPLGTQGRGEIESLSYQLEVDCCRPALRTYFDRNQGRFVPANRPNLVIAGRARARVLAWSFERRLMGLIATDRPRVKDFAMANMPFVYRLDLPEALAASRQEWERKLNDAGFDDVISFLRTMGDLTNIDEIGQVPEERREEVQRAQAANDIDRAVELLKDTERELKSFLFRETQRLLDYRAPRPPRFGDPALRPPFERAKVLAESGDPDKVRQSLAVIERVWSADIDNVTLREWVAYLRARTGNLPSAQELLEGLQKRLPPQQAVTSSWNLAVLASHKKNEALAYQLILPILDMGDADPSLVLVVLGLALKLNDRQRFLDVIPLTMSRRFHPLAVSVAHAMGDRPRVEDLLGQLILHWNKTWDLLRVPVILPSPFPEILAIPR